MTTLQGKSQLLSSIPNDPAALEKICAWSIQALSAINTPDRRVQLRSGVSEVAIQYAPVEVYEGDTGWYFVGNIILPMDRTLIYSDPDWRCVTALNDADIPANLLSDLLP